MKNIFSKSKNTDSEITGGLRTGEAEKIWTITQDIGPGIEFSGVLMWSKKGKVGLIDEEKSIREIEVSLFNIKGKYLIYITYTSSLKFEMGRKRAFANENLDQVAQSLVRFSQEDIPAICQAYGEWAGILQASMIRLMQQLNFHLCSEVSGTSVKL